MIIVIIIIIFIIINTIIIIIIIIFIVICMNFTITFHVIIIILIDVTISFKLTIVQLINVNLKIPLHSQAAWSIMPLMPHTSVVAVVVTRSGMDINYKTAWQCAANARTPPFLHESKHRHTNTHTHPYSIDVKALHSSISQFPPLPFQTLCNPLSDPLCCCYCSFYACMLFAPVRPCRRVESLA